MSHITNTNFSTISIATTIEKPRGYRGIRVKILSLGCLGQLCRNRFANCKKLFRRLITLCKLSSLWDAISVAFNKTPDEIKAEATRQDNRQQEIKAQAIDAQTIGDTF
jgi:hypothetical protein